MVCCGSRVTTASPVKSQTRSWNITSEVCVIYHDSTHFVWKYNREMYLIFSKRERERGPSFGMCQQKQIE